MNKTRIILALICFSLILPGLAISGASSPYVRMPALNHNGSQVLFTYQGDIWVVDSKGGHANRLTGNPANDTRPVWSPDDKSIAFSSDRYGNYDIYTLPLNGQPVKQITYHSENDIASAWNGKRIFFTSERFFPQVEREDEMMVVSQKGGTPNRYIDAVGYEPVPSPSGRFTAFVRGSCRTAREAYRGAANRDLWIYDHQNDNYHQLTEFDGNDYQPKWRDDNTILFISSRSGNYNIHQIRLENDGTLKRQPKQLTDFPEDAVRSFSVSKDGKVIAFEKGTSLYILREEQDAKKLEISLPSDQMLPKTAYKTYKKEMKEYRISPNAKYIAFTVHGNLYVKLNHKEGAQAKAITSTAARVTDFDWLNNTTLIYACDKHNQYDLFLAEGDEETPLTENYRFEHSRLTNTPENESQPVLSPDGKKIVFRRGNGNLYTATLDNKEFKKVTPLLEGWSAPSHLAWSPDSKWLAYSKRDLNGNREIFIQKADGSQPPQNVSMHPRSDSHPVWSHDKLAFLSERNNSDDDIWFVWLRKKDWQRTKREWKSIELTDSTVIDSTDIRIDFEDIHERITQVTGLPGNESDLQVSPDGKTFYFVTNRNDRRRFKARNNLFSIKWDGSKLKPLNQGNKTPYSVKLGPDAKFLYMLRTGGKLARFNIKKKKEEPQPFSASMYIDYAQQREQIFEEAWRALQNRFYDPDFHGEDWNALKEKYKPRAMAASTNNDFRYTFNQMLGQVNASHMGLRNVDKRYETPDIKTGKLGIDITPKKEGIIVDKVLDRTPASRPESHLHKGDIITHVDRQPVNNQHNFYKPLNNKAHKQVRLTIKRNGATKKVIIRPSKRINKQLYEDWVDSRKALTRKYSDGKLGYIHIRGMNWNSFERFERELAATAYKKEGLVIDVRFNGGGWTTDYLMTILDVRQHAYTIPRGAANDLKKEHKQFTEHYPFGERLPFFPWTKPSVALCNQNSYSNAEIFSHAYKTLDLGTLVGTPTFGAVISTGARRLVDGSYVRIPFRAWYVKATQQNMEHNGAVPDLLQYNEPGSKAKGKDPQLRKAVETLLEQIEKK